ncbi:cell division protein ZapE [Shewanella livingstonensis]|uniref:AFG1 family ATPase n=1 Tax=Shewanella livingstonensis TaxID=150120 RepID=A0A3G8LY12_9GAMM|nr:cell division protein ZapE [Shewanella livingstonensis]AZG74579.1 AFG1 family ATPase [Shewanella livingstonensis]
MLYYLAKQFTLNVMSPLQAYQQRVQHNILNDPAQQQAVLALDALYQQCLSTSKISRGLYLWGDVGRGKTFLMDLFYQSLCDHNLCSSQPEANKSILRLHFHRFMAMIHQQLNQTSGIRDPLIHIAKQIAAKYSVICFDEFFVSDIGDAILLGRLFDTLFQSGVTLVATSNVAIVDLYKNGLQRDRFLPTIDLLLQYTQAIHLNGQIDHRLHSSGTILTTSTPWLTLPSSIKPKAVFQLLCLQYPQASACMVNQPHFIEVYHRDIAIEAEYGRLAWFEFSALCEGPRSALDYIELAGQFSHILLSDIPTLGGEVRSWIKARGTEDGALATSTGERQLAYASEDDPTRRFISLVDELYDQKVMLILNSHCNLEDLYLNGALQFEFRRTYSRLIEMQQWA